MDRKMRIPILLFTALTLLSCDRSLEDNERIMSAGGKMEQAFPALAPAKDRLVYNRTGELEGYESMNTLIRHRLLDHEAETTDQFAIEAIGGLGIYQVRYLMGRYEITGEISQFRGGEPNPFNSMIWYNQLKILADEIGKTCDQPTDQMNRIRLKSMKYDEAIELEFTLRDELSRLLPVLCAWNDEKTIIKDALQRFWLIVMSYDAPYLEMQEWLTFFLEGNQWEQTPAPERLSALFETIFLNPYFILQE